jgi:CRISPR-associated protein Cas5t
MHVKKITIMAPMGHFKIPYATRLLQTYPIPPVSTVYGMLKVIYGEKINSFKFGYTFQSRYTLTDSITIHKINISKKKHENNVSDCCLKDYLVDCTLVIYTTINDKETINTCLTMGRSNCLARLIKIEEIELEHGDGILQNQWTPVHIGSGEIKKISVCSKFNKKLNSFDTQVANLRLNLRPTEYNKNLDNETNSNIYMYEFKNEEVLIND